MLKKMIHPRISFQSSNVRSRPFRKTEISLFDDVVTNELGTFKVPTFNSRSRPSPTTTQSTANPTTPAESTGNSTHEQGRSPSREDIGVSQPQAFEPAEGSSVLRFQLH